MSPAPTRRSSPFGLALSAVALAGCLACSGPAPDRGGSSSVSVPPARSVTPAADGSDGSGASSESDDERDGKPQNEPGVERTATTAAAAALTWARVTCPPSTVRVTSTAQLVEALTAAGPGTVIELADGTYTGAFVTTRSGTAASPAWLCGGPNAVLEGEGVKSGYVLHLDGATHWRLVGFAVTDGQKGVVADTTVGTVIQGLTVSHTGDEAIHLRRNSTDNAVIGNTVSDTGNRRDKFGEGVYVGTAISNWCTITACRPDRSDRNVVAENTISGTTSENIDIKEGTVNGLVVGNRLDGAGVVAADSVIDVKGTAWVVTGNQVAQAPFDGIQTHQIEERWGERNLFSRNAIAGGSVRPEVADQVDADDKRYGIALRPDGENVVTCDNTVTGPLTLATKDCSPTPSG